MGSTTMMNTNVYNTFSCHNGQLINFQLQIWVVDISLIDDNQEFSFQFDHKRISKEIFLVIQFQIVGPFRIKGFDRDLNLIQSALHLH